MAGKLSKIANMKFTQYLKSLINSGAYKVSELAEKSGVYLSDLSKIVNGKRPCGKIALVKLLGVMEPDHSAQLLKRWLEDQIPEELPGMVYVVLGPGAQVSEEPALLGTLEGDLEILRRVAEAHPPVRKVLTAMAASY